MVKGENPGRPRLEAFPPYFLCASSGASKKGGRDVHRSDDSAMSGLELWLAVTLPTVTNPRRPNEANDGGLGRTDPGASSSRSVDHELRVMESPTV